MMLAFRPRKPRSLVAVALLIGAWSTGAGQALADRNPLPPYLHKGSFERIAHKRGVTVYKHKTSDIIRVGAEAVFPAPPDKVQRALVGYRRQLGKVGRLSEVRILGRGASGPDAGKLVIYQRLNLPVISDRDYVLKVRYGIDGPTRWVSYSALNDGKGPKPRSGIVRVSHHRGSWQLTPVQGGKATKVTYQLSIDLGGWLPKWLARSGAGRELPEVLGEICRLSGPDKRYGKCP